MTKHPISNREQQAVRAVMQLIAADDLLRGVPADDRRRCEGCRREQPSAGFIQYPGALLCNRCATRYELARVRHEMLPGRDVIMTPRQGTPPATQPARQPPAA